MQKGGQAHLGLPVIEEILEQGAHLRHARKGRTSTTVIMSLHCTVIYSMGNSVTKHCCSMKGTHVLDAKTGRVSTGARTPDMTQDRRHLLK